MFCENLRNIISSGINPIIEFTELAEDLDTGINVGMRGKLESVSSKDVNDCYELTINCSDWYEYNYPLFTHDWLNKETGNFDLTAIEAGQYPKNHIIKIYDIDEGEDHNIRLIEDNKFYQEYLATKIDTESYVYWLENQLKVARKTV
jgi:hypothetical protein